MISANLKDRHITQYSFGLDRGQVMVTRTTSEATLFAVYRINNGVIIGKNFELENGALGIEKDYTYSYYWNN